MFCNALLGIFGSVVNCGQLFKCFSLAIQMAFATKECIDYQGSTPSDKMNEGNHSVNAKEVHPVRNGLEKQHSRLHNLTSPSLTGRCYVVREMRRM